MREIRKILVANRGEIACRVLRTARALGIATVTVHTVHDREAPHAAGESVEVGSYLDVEAIVAAGRSAGADALHPGYGFLSENPALARACAASGIAFIGPSPEAMEAVGDKARARELATRLHIPVADGAGPFGDLAGVRAAVQKLGPPLMLKAAAGGGGKGMKRLTSMPSAPELDEIIASSQRESGAAFGDPRLIVERYVHPARHVEVQILGDGQRAIAVGERECSLQRRHQKIIEESPSTAVDASLRERLFAAARRIAEAAGYSGAGTVEFLVGPDGSFYFLEVNARLQVEHPVTELRTGLDLVAQQIAIVRGEGLPDEGALSFRGHAIEARLCAEDPRHHFLPSAGRLLLLQWPDGVRVDTGVGKRVTTHYDSLLAKIVSWGADREEARRKLVEALRRTSVLGVMTNQSYLIDLLEGEPFVTGRTFTTTVDELPVVTAPLPVHLAQAAALELLRPPARGVAPAAFSSLGTWRLG